MNYHFSKLGREGWKSLAHPDGSPPDPNAAAARAVFLSEYGLSELTRPPMTARAKADLQVAIRRRRVPNWALSMLTAEEFEELTQGGGT